MKPKALICDLDGSLCDIEHRRPYLEEKPKNWKKFNELMGQDTPNFKVARAVSAFFQAGYQVIFVTGRMETHRVETTKWMRKWFPAFSDFPILMRKAQDFRDDAIVKKEIYEETIEPRFDVQLVLDDRKKVVEMWRALGLECWALAHGDY
jgi:hypothetical protein